MTTLLEGDRLKLSTQVLVTGQAKHQLTVLSPVHLILQGSASGQVIALPSALTLKPGWMYFITNNSTKAVIVRDFVGNTLGKLEAEERLEVICLDNTSPKGDWAKSLIAVSHNPVSNCLFTMNFQGQGLANGQWLSFHSLLDSTKVLPVIPFELCHIVGISFTNSQKNASASVGLYKNGTTDINLFHEFTFSQVQSQGIFVGPEIIIKHNDTVSIYVKPISGGAFIPENVCVTVYFKIIRP